MKVAFTTTGTDLGAPLDERFGRAPRFLVYDVDSGAIEVIGNRAGVEASGGAGIQAAEAIARSGARSLVTGHCGPNAFRVLAAAGIQVYPSSAATVEEALEAFRAGRLEEARGADVPGHWA